MKRLGLAIVLLTSLIAMGCQRSTPDLPMPPNGLLTTHPYDISSLVSTVTDPNIGNWLNACLSTIQPLVYPFPGYTYRSVEISRIKDLATVPVLVMDGPGETPSDHMRLEINGLVADDVGEEWGADSHDLVIPKTNLAALDCGMIQNNSDGIREVNQTEYYTERRVPDPVVDLWLEPIQKQVPKLKAYTTDTSVWEWTETADTITVTANFRDESVTDTIQGTDVEFTLDRTTGTLTNFTTEDYTREYPLN
jgi:hypothetical protein